MKFQKVLALSLLLLGTTGLTACDPNQPSSSSVSSSSSSSSWQPGENAIDGAEQPYYKSEDLVADLNDLGKMRLSQDKFGLPQKGKANILVVPVTFLEDSNDEKFTSNQLTNLKSAYFDSEVSDNSYPSVKAYYADISNGELDIDGVVSPSITLPDNAISYLERAYLEGETKIKTEILEYIYDYLFEETQTYNLADFDSNKDGKIDGIVLAYGYPSFKDDTLYQASDSSSQAIFANLFNSDTYFNCDFSYYWKESKVNSFTFTSGKYIESFYINPTSGTYNKASRDSHEFIKQVGRMLGLEDYSDLTGNANGNYRAPLAGSDMMEIAVGSHNPFSLYSLGYIQPQKLVASQVSSSVDINLTEDNSTLILETKDNGIFGEYLMVQLYTPTGVNKLDSTSPYYLNHQTSSQLGIRVYKVDSRLVRGYDDYELYEDSIDFDASLINSKGEEVKYRYDYAFTNSYTNKYSSYGIGFEFPLVEILKKDESNRHMLSSSYTYSDDDMFYQGDVFGDDTPSEFYKNFKFDGDGYNREALGLKFTVKTLNKTNNSATITVERI